MGATLTPMQKLVRWYRTEHTHRTAKVRIGIAPIDWIDPGTRVSWSEVYEKARELGITTDVATLRVEFDLAKKRGA